MKALVLLAVFAAAPDGGSPLTVTIAHVSAGGDDFLRRRGIEELNPNLGIKPFAAESGAEPELVSEKTPIHVKVNQARFIRFPCAPSRIAFSNTPWDFTPTNTRGEGFLRGTFVGRAPLIIWCGATTRGFHVFVDP